MVVKKVRLGGNKWNGVWEVTKTRREPVKVIHEWATQTWNPWHKFLLFLKSFPPSVKHNTKSSSYPVSHRQVTMISSTPHSPLLLSTVVIQLKSKQVRPHPLVSFCSKSLTTVIHSQGKERESFCWLFSYAYFLNESNRFWNLCKHTARFGLAWPHTLPLHTHRSSDSGCWFPATPTLPFSISMAVVRQPASGEVLWVELKKLHACSCLKYLHMQVHLVAVATTSAIVWKLRGLGTWNIAKIQFKWNIFKSSWKNLKKI